MRTPSYPESRYAPIQPISLVRRRDTHRLIPAKYSARDPLAEIAETDTQLPDLVALSHTTSELSLGENGLLPAISPQELTSEVPLAHIINVAFIHAHPLGSRFNNADRGAWYAAFQLSTSQAEVAFHKTVHLAEVGRYEDEVEFDDYLADFHGAFHDLRRARLFGPCLDPRSYVASQTLAERLLENGSVGVTYPSARRARGTCLACFDPRHVRSVRRGGRFRFTWCGKPTPRIERVSPTSKHASKRLSA